MIKIKSKREIEIMTQAGKIVALCHQEIAKIIAPGVTTKQIDNLVENIIRENGATPSFKGLGGFPSAVCASPNEQVVHGFPDDKPLVEGDIISIDIGANYKGYHGDSAWTYPVGKISEEKQHLLTETEQSLWVGLDKVKAGIHLSDVSHAIQKHAESKGLSVVREMCGHGVGSDLHEEPEILNYGPAGKGPILKAGMVLAIEPMLNLGTEKIIINKDGWTTRTVDNKPSAHFEHTIVVLDDGYKILTELGEETT